MKMGRGAVQKWSQNFLHFHKIWRKKLLELFSWILPAGSLFWNKSGIFVNCSVIFCNNSPEELPACSLMPAHVIALQHDALCILTLRKYLGKCEYFYAFWSHFQNTEKLCLNFPELFLIPNIREAYMSKCEYLFILPNTEKNFLKHQKYFQSFQRGFSLILKWEVFL